MESDSQRVVSELQQEEIPADMDAFLFTECRRLIRKPWELSLVWTPRRNNGAVDAMAKLAFCQDEDLGVDVFWENPHAIVVPFLESDVN